MNLTTEHAYWTLLNGLGKAFPPQDIDVRCDVAVLGAGVSGALVAQALVAGGHDVAVFDKRDAGWGSTSASTALLQYEIDTHLIDLIKQYGEVTAGHAYRACYEAIDHLERVIRTENISCDFERVPSLYVASTEHDAGVLRQEGEARHRLGISAEYWSAADIENRFPFRRHGALLSEQAAQLDPYRLTQGLLAAVVKRGGRVHDRTEITAVDNTSAGIRLTTSRGFRVEARWLVVASGYETVECFPMKKLVSLRSSYAIVSEPLATPEPWWRKTLLWESDRPYAYFRTTADQRVILGGEDSPFRNPAARDRLLPKKCAALEKRLREWFPDLTAETGYSWAGTFGETKDGLAYIGEHPDHPRCLFALGFGGNGIVYSMVAAECFAARLAGTFLPFEGAFAFNR